MVLIMPAPVRWTVDLILARTVAAANGCRVWVGCRGTRGYGVIRIGSRQTQAHRLLMQIKQGDALEGREVCHACDNPPCCNPAHLFIGTHRDNMVDMARKKRRYDAKLSLGDIAAIRNRAASEAYASIAADYGIDPSTVGQVFRRSSWGHAKGGAAHVNKIKKVTEDDVRSIRARRAAGESRRAVAEAFGITESNVKTITSRTTWRHVE